MKLHRLKNQALLLTIVAALLGLLLVTNPQDLPIVLLILPFLLLFAALFFATSLLIRRFLPGMEHPRRVFFALCASGFPVLLLVLSSINQLTRRDVLLVIVLAVFLVFYGGRINFSKR